MTKIDELMHLARLYALQTKYDYENQLNGKPTDSAESHAQRLRSALEAALKPGGASFDYVALLYVDDDGELEIIHGDLPTGEVKVYTAPPAQTPPLTTCNCRWDGDKQVQQCTLHEAHVDAIHEWAERAKSAEAKLKEQTPPPRLTDEMLAAIYIEKPRYHYPPIASTDVEFARAIESAVRKQFGVNDE